MSSVVFKSLVEQCRLLRSGELKSVELTNHYIDRIQRSNSELNIVIRQNFDRAIERARTLDAHLAQFGVPVGPLHGIPFTIKDGFRIKGLATSFGIPGLRWLPAFDSCRLVERLTDAGAVIIGQTNVPFSCFDWQTNSPIYGLTKNPLNPEKTVGGSSGGSAASVAGYLSPFEVGSDVAGSIRYPAHCCGVYGLRPSHQAIPFEDVGPMLHKSSFSNLAVAGPIARSIADLRLVFNVLAKQKDDSVPGAGRLRIAYTLDWCGIFPEEASYRRLSELIDRARTLGHELEPVVPRINMAECERVWGVILGFEYKQMIPLFLRFRPFLDVFNYFFNIRRFREGTFKDAFQGGVFASRREYEHALARAAEIRKDFYAEFESFDLWLTPVSSGPAIDHQPTGRPQILNSRKIDYAAYIGNFLTGTALLHHPILVAPIGGSEGEHPIGVQLHGKTQADMKLLSDCEKLGPLFAEPARS